MAGETIITIIGNLTGDPELRYLPSGVPVVNFTIASTPRVFNKPAEEWRDGDTLFMRCCAWRDLAENTANSLEKGTRVIASGRLKQRSWGEDENKRTVFELECDEIGPSLRYASTQVRKAQRDRTLQSVPDYTGGDGEPPF